MTVGYGYRRRDIEAEFLALHACRVSFAEYVRRTVLSRPGYVGGKHIDDFCDFAQRVADGEVRRGIVTVPPRHMKSTVFSEALPSWYAFRHPQRSMIVAAYADSHAYKISGAVAMQTGDREHRRVFPSPEWRTKNIQDMTLEGKVDGRPNIIFRGVGSGITGSGADLAIIDDPIKGPEDASSIKMRDKVDEWFKSVLLTRLSPEGAVLVVMTRWHHDDIVGRLLLREPDVWDVLHMPAISPAGEALWPERYSLDHLQGIKRSVGTRVFEALYQGRPTPAEGGMFRRAWFRHAEGVLGEDARRVRFWDAAATEGGGDWTVGVLMARDGDGMRIEDVARIQGSAAEVQRLVLATAEADGPNVAIRMEEEGGSSGKLATDTYARLLRGYSFRGVRATGPKDVRAAPLAADLENGLLTLRRAAWNMDFVDELTEFPNGRHDDQVDAASGAHAELARRADGAGIRIF